MSEMLLQGTAQGEQLRLAGAGAWTAENARSLEAQIDAETRRGDAVKRVDIDMGRVDRLDTFGAWLLERLTRSFAARGCQTQIIGLREDYRALMDEVHGIKDEPPAPGRGNPVINALASVGVNIVAVAINKIASAPGVSQIVNATFLSDHRGMLADPDTTGAQ